MAVNTVQASGGSPPKLNTEQQGALAKLIQAHGGDPSQLKQGADPKALFQQLNISRDEVDSALGLSSSVTNGTNTSNTNQDTSSSST